MSFFDVALIPSRGGSKGLHRKNLLEIHGHSLLQRAIESAKESEVFSEIFVSSEDSEILTVSGEFGASTVERDLWAATDSATAPDVVRDFLSKYTYNDNKDLRIAYLQPTSPFRSGEHIKQALTIADNHKSKSCVSICKVKQHPSKIVSAYMDSIEPWADSKMAALTSNRQSLPALYLPNGAIYVFPLYRFQETMTFPIMGSGFLEMDEYSSIDVDSEFDFSVAQALENK